MVLLPENWAPADAQRVHAGLLKRSVARVRRRAKPRAVEPAIADRCGAENPLPVKCGAADKAAFIAPEHEVGGPFQLSMGIVGAAL